MKDTYKAHIGQPRNKVKNMFEAYDGTYNFGDWFYNEQDKTFYMVTFSKLATIK